MKKKIGSSKPIKKYAMGGQDGPGPKNTTDSIPSYIKDKYKADARKSMSNWVGKEQEETGKALKNPKEYKRQQMSNWVKEEQNMSNKKPTYDTYKKGGSVGKTMKMGGSVKKSSSKKK